MQSKNLKRLLRLLFYIVLLFGCYCDAVCEDTYGTIDGNGELVVNAGVKSIKASAFYYCYDITKLVLPAGFESVESSAFYNAFNLKEIVVTDPLSLKRIDHSGFRGTKISSFNFTEAITHIGEYAFSGTSLREVDFVSQTGHISRYMFYLCKSLEKVVLHSEIRSVEDKAFYSCTKLKVFTLTHAKLQKIGHDAFGYTALTEFDLPAGLTYLGQSAFQETDLRKVIIPVSVQEWYGNTFQYCQELTNVTLSPGLTTLGSNYAFTNCPKLTQIFIPSSIVNWGSEIFKNSGLQKVTLGDNLQSIGKAAFRYADKLEDVFIPSNLSVIENNAFEDCTSLHKLSFEKLTTNAIGMLTHIGAEAFKGCTSLQEVSLPNGLSSIGNKAFYQSSELQNVSIPSTLREAAGADHFTGTKVTEICSYHILDNYSMPATNAYPREDQPEMAIPSYLDHVAPYAFYGCQGLQEVRLTPITRKVGTLAFSKSSVEKLFIVLDKSRPNKPFKDIAFSDNSFQDTHNMTYIVLAGSYNFSRDAASFRSDFASSFDLNLEGVHILDYSEPCNLSLPINGNNGECSPSEGDAVPLWYACSQNCNNGFYASSNNALAALVGKTRNSTCFAGTFYTVECKPVKCDLTLVSSEGNLLQMLYKLGNIDINVPSNATELDYMQKLTVTCSRYPSVELYSLECDRSPQNVPKTYQSFDPAGWGPGKDENTIVTSVLNIMQSTGCINHAAYNCSVSSLVLPNNTQVYESRTWTIIEQSAVLSAEYTIRVACDRELRYIGPLESVVYLKCTSQNTWTPASDRTLNATFVCGHIVSNSLVTPKECYKGCFTYGGEEIRVRGENLPLDAEYSLVGNFMGSQSQMPYVATRYDSSNIYFTLPPGSGVNKDLFVTASFPSDDTVAQITSLSVGKISYCRPTIINVSGCKESKLAGGVLGAYSCSFSGGDTLQITGSCFGPPTIPVVVVVDGKVCGTYNHTHSKIFCHLPPNQGQELKVITIVDGQISDARESVNYVDCEAGKYVHPARSVYGCFGCRRGKFAPTINEPSCTSCPNGKYAAEDLASVCNFCPLGFKGVGIGSWNCSECAPGKYQDEYGAKSCKDCAEGQYRTSDAKRLSSCISCERGHFCISSNSKPALCPRGYYQDQVDQTSCKVCSANEYAVKKGSSNCQPCPPNSSSGKGKAVCLCNKNFVGVTNITTAIAFANNLVCYDCPLGTNCKNLAGVVVEPNNKFADDVLPFTPASKYWQSLMWFLGSNFRGRQILTKQFVTHGINENLENLHVAHNCYSEVCTGGGFDRCGGSFNTGIMCASCSANTTISNSAKQNATLEELTDPEDQSADNFEILPAFYKKLALCKPCNPLHPGEQNWDSLIIFFVVISFIFIFFIAVFLMMKFKLKCFVSIVAKIKQMRASSMKKKRGRYYRPEYSTELDIQSFSKKLFIIINYFQVVALLVKPETLGHEYDSSYEDFSNAAMAVTNLDFIGLISCVFRVSFAVKVTIFMLLPISAIALFQGLRACKKISKKTTVSLTLRTLIILYITVTSKILLAFKCAMFIDGQARLDASNYNIVCYTSTEHQIMLAFAILGSLVFVVGIPLLLFVFIFRNRRSLDDRLSKVDSRWILMYSKVEQLQLELQRLKKEKIVVDTDTTTATIIGEIRKESAFYMKNAYTDIQSLCQNLCSSYATYNGEEKKDEESSSLPSSCTLSMSARKKDLMVSVASLKIALGAKLCQKTAFDFDAWDMYGFIVSPYNQNAWFAEPMIMVNKLMISSVVVFLNPGSSTQHFIALLWILIFTIVTAGLPAYFHTSDQVCFLITQFALCAVVLQALASPIVDNPNHDPKDPLKGLLDVIDGLAWFTIGVAICYSIVLFILNIAKYMKKKKMKKKMIKIFKRVKGSNEFIESVVKNSAERANDGLSSNKSMSKKKGKKVFPLTSVGHVDEDRNSIDQVIANEDSLPIQATLEISELNVEDSSLDNFDSIEMQEPRRTRTKMYSMQ